MIKLSVQEEDISIMSINALNIGAPQYVQQMLTNMKGEINNKTIIVGDLIPHSHLKFERFHEDLQDLLQLTPKDDVLFIIGD